MSVDTHTPLSHYTALHFLALSPWSEREILPVVTWLVGMKGADATCQDHKGRTAAQVAFDSGKINMQYYLLRQGTTSCPQGRRKGRRKEEGSSGSDNGSTDAGRKGRRWRQEEETIDIKGSQVREQAKNEH